MINILNESNFEKEMRLHVLPFLKRKRKDFVIQVNGGDLACCRYDADHPKGSVLISHGFTESKEKYAEVIWYFLQEGYNVWILDHAGHGSSYRLNTDPYLVHVDSFQRYANDLNALARKARFSTPHLPLYLYAHSMGGAIALLAAEKKPEFYSALLLSSIMVKAKTGILPWRTARQIAHTASAIGRGNEYAIGQSAFKEEAFEDSCSTSKARFEWYQKKRRNDQRLQTSAADYDWFKASAAAYKEMYEMRDRICVPVVLLQAYEDELVDNEAQLDFVSGLKNSPDILIRIFKNTKHEIYNAEAPVLHLYWQTIFSFLEECRQKAG